MMAVATFERGRKFKAAPGAGFNDEKAQIYGDFLEQLGLGDRLVPAEEIVKAAKPKRSPIHERIFYDTIEQAAHQEHLNRARHLVRHIIVERPHKGKKVETRAYHHVTSGGDEPERGYVSERVVWRSEELKPQVVAKALAELRLWMERYEQYSELAGIRRTIGEALDEAA